MSRRGRPVLGAISGFFLGLFLAADSWAFGMVRSDSVVLTVLPFLFAVLGIVLAMVAPLRRRGSSGSREPASDAGSVDADVTDDEPAPDEAEF